jgi:hypothetical protein
MFGLLGQVITVGAHAVGLATHATPAMRGNDLTEAYLTQPAVMAHAGFGPFEFSGMINLEGLTLRRGELNAGVWGEGYVDRRHPHTYLHEAILTYQTRLIGGRVSLSAGRGFAPFGTDDPMVRHFVKYPSNHHLAQILERLVVIGAIAGGPVILEGGVFNGTEPINPEDFGDVDKFGDSWSARVTLLPRSWLELQGSYAEVTSPENQFGDGLDHHLWNVSARVARTLGNAQAYFLIETGETKEVKGGAEFFFYETLLAEAAVSRDAWQLAARFERSVRPEEERQLDLFRSVRPHGDNSILGTTRWTSGGLQLSRDVSVRNVRLKPFAEVFRLHAKALEEFAALRPEDIYGSRNLWSFSVGIRSTIGTWHERMGRYGATQVVTAHQRH